MSATHGKEGLTVKRDNPRPAFFYSDGQGKSVKIIREVSR